MDAEADWTDGTPPDHFAPNAPDVDALVREKVRAELVLLRVILSRPVSPNIRLSLVDDFLRHWGV